MLVVSRKLKRKIAPRTVRTAVNTQEALACLGSDAPPEITAPWQGVRDRAAESRVRVAAEAKQDPFKRLLSEWLKKTGMGLGLLRLHLDAGLFEEARAALACIQADFQLLRLGVDGETESLCPKRPAPAALLRDLDEELDDCSCGV